jgi:hypothetical protein
MIENAGGNLKAEKRRAAVLDNDPVSIYLTIYLG